MNANLPNLELLEYKTKMILKEDANWLLLWNNLKEEKSKKGTAPIFELTCEVFSQIWGSTSTAFGGFGGCAMTKAYTTIFHEINTDVYVVFIDNKPAYMVLNATKEFFEDLKNHNMASAEDGKNKY